MVGVAKRQRVQHNSVDQAEDRCGSSNPKRNNGCRQGRECRTAAQKANAIEEVTNKEAHFRIDGAGRASYRITRVYNYELLARDVSRKIDSGAGLGPGSLDDKGRTRKPESSIAGVPGRAAGIGGHLPFQTATLLFTAEVT